MTVDYQEGIRESPAASEGATLRILNAKDAKAGRREELRIVKP